MEVKVKVKVKIKVKIRLLVRVLHESLMTLGKCRHDGCITLLHTALHIVGSLARGDNGLVYNDAQGMVVHKIETLHAGENFETAINRDGDNGQLKGIGQLERSTTEDTHVARKGSGSFGKHTERCTSRECLLGIAHRLHDGMPRGFVHENEARFPAGIAHQGDAAKTLLHHPFELMWQETVDAENIERSLMVGHKHIALPTVHTLQTFHMHGKQEHPHHGPCPKGTKGTGGKGGKAKHGEKDNQNTGHSRQEQPEREYHKELVYLIKERKHSL